MKSELFEDFYLYNFLKIDTQKYVASALVLY